MVSITIDQNSCIKCNKCVRICTSVIFKNETENQKIETEHVESCISCGHCVAVCPTDSISHSDFPNNKIHTIDKSLLPSSEQVGMLLKSRRSNRAFTSKPVPEEFLKQIVDAAHRAPTASNEQGVSYTVVTDPEKLKLISQYTIDVFSSILNMIKPFKSIIKLFSPEVVGLIPEFEEMRSLFLSGKKDLIVRNAKAVIFIHTPKSSRFGCQDSNLAYQNASLMAESLGVGHFYTGFVCVANGIDTKKRLNKALGIDGVIHAGMALGMPGFGFEKYIDRKDLNVNWI